MPDVQRFIVFMIAAAAVFAALLAFVLRRRPHLDVSRIAALTLIVVAGGMLFARYGHIFGEFPWWIYYGLPAALTLLSPPLVLKMSKNEAALYVPPAFLMAPAIHIFFSLLVGWHDYMPFPVYIPSLFELSGGP